MSARAASASRAVPAAAAQAVAESRVPAPPAPVAPRATSRRRRRRTLPAARPTAAARPWGKLLLVAIALVVLLGAAAGAAWLASSDRFEPAPPARDRAIAVGGASVDVPAGWAPARLADAKAPGLVEPAAVFAPVPGLDAYAIVALGTSGVPPALRDLIGPLGRGRPTTLAGVPARVYGPRPSAGDRMAQLTVARTGAGTLAVACVAASAAWSGVEGCAEDIAASGTARSHDD